MIDLICYVVIAVVAYHIGKHWAMWKFSQNISQNPDHMIKVLEQIKQINSDIDLHDMPEDAIPLELEEVNGQVYAYNKVTGEFLAQAPTIYLAGVAAVARYPNKKFWHPSFKEDSQTA